MNPIFKDIVLLIVSSLPLMGAGAESIVDGSWRDFGVENQDTVIVLNCYELVNNANTPLFYADFRDWFTVEADFKLNTRVTEQAFICKEGRNGDMAGDLTIGFDPEEERIFAEIKDEDGNLHRIKAGDKVDMGKWYSVNIDARKDANGNNSNMKLSVKPEGGLSSSETVSYKGNALPYWTYGGLLTGPARYGFTIHPSVNEFKGKWYFFYHDGSYMFDGQPGGDCRRSVCMEEMKFNPDGSIVPITLTEEGISKIH